MTEQVEASSLPFVSGFVMCGGASLLSCFVLVSLTGSLHRNRQNCVTLFGHPYTDIPVALNSATYKFQRNSEMRIINVCVIRIRSTPSLPKLNPNPPNYIFGKVALL